MKIGLYCDAWHIGGVAAYTERLATGFADREQEVFLIVGDPYHKRDAAGKTAYARLLATTRVPVLCLNLKAFHERERVRRASECFVSLNCDALVLSTHRSLSRCLPQLGQRSILIGIAHSDEPYYFEEFAETFAQCDAYVAVSTSILDQLSRSISADTVTRLEHIPSGVPVPATLAAPAVSDPLRVLVACRLEQPQKRVRDLPEIWRCYRAAGGDGTLTICGSGPCESELRRAFATEIATGRVTMPGAVPYERMPEVFGRHDVFLSCSGHEGLPLAVLEAVTHGLYPVLSRIRSGHVEITQTLGVGELCNVGDTGGFARGLVRMERERPELRSMRATIAARAGAHFGLPRMVTDYLTLLSVLAGQPGRSRRGTIGHEGPAQRRVHPLHRLWLKWKYSRHYGWPATPPPIHNPSSLPHGTL